MVEDHGDEDAEADKTEFPQRTRRLWGESNGSQEPVGLACQSAGSISLRL